MVNHVVDGTNLRSDGPTGTAGAVYPPLVLVHGVGLDLHLWDLVVDVLAVDRLVIRYDLFGHGHSDDPTGPRSIDDFVSQCLGVLAATTIEDTAGRTPDLAGLSLGAMVALAVGARHPQAIGRLVAMNAVFNRTADQIEGPRARLALTAAEGMGPVADLAIARWFTIDWQVEHPERAAAVDERIRTTDLDGYLKAYGLFVEGDPAMPAGAARITAPTLALTGERDTGSTPAMSRAIALAVIDGQSRVLSGLGHLPPIEAPESWSAALLEFLDRPNQP